MIVDLRSDTVTQPTKAMKEFMFNAPLGDDVWGDDPSVNELEKLAAEMFGKGAAVFCTSGTQTNQVAIKVHTQPGDEVICHEEAHIYRYEGGGIMANSGASVRFLRGNHGRIMADDISAQVNPDDQHHPITRLVSIEDTSNRGGGMAYDFTEVKKISAVCRKLNLALHLDGARIFNALAVTGVTPKEYGQCVDSISICLSKGLGAPVGSVLIGDKHFIAKARRVRKLLGGAMRQAGIIASAGTFALKNNISRLTEDHRRARIIADKLVTLSWVDGTLPVQTNIVVVNLAEGNNESKVSQCLKSKGIFCVPFGIGRIRFVTHLGIDDKQIDFFLQNIPANI